MGQKKLSKGEVSPRWPVERENKLKELHALGWPPREITPALNEMPGSKLTRSSVCGKIRRLGLATSAEEIANARRLIRLQNREHAKARTEDWLQRKAQRKAAKPRTYAPKPPASPRIAGLSRKPQILEVTMEDASLARPWTERRSRECAWPISGEGADTFSCCQPTEATYCPAHAARMFAKPNEVGSRYARSLRRWVA